MIDTVNVSVVLPVHNGMPYLPETINSILKQTLSDFELIIIDDGSTDETKLYLDSIDDKRIIYHHLNKVGQAEAMNYGIMIARSPYVVRIDGDDIAAEDRFAVQFDYCKRNPEVVLMGVNAVIINESGIPIGETRYPISDEALRWKLLFACCFLHPGTIFRREDALAVGGYRHQYESTEDYDLWTRLSKRGRLANDPRQLMRYRMHSASVSAQKRKLQWSLSCAVAGEYAGTIDAVLTPGIIKINHMLRFREEPDISMLPEMVAAFRKSKEIFLADKKTEIRPDLQRYIDQIQTDLRWRCVEFAEKNRWNALNYARWIKAAGQFDPRGGTVRAALTRKLRKVLTNPSRTRREEFENGY